jgi:hypothetical protein
MAQAGSRRGGAVSEKRGLRQCCVSSHQQSELNARDQAARVLPSEETFWRPGTGKGRPSR